jgi:hypothetical protein
LTPLLKRYDNTNTENATNSEVAHRKRCDNDKTAAHPDTGMDGL